MLVPGKRPAGKPETGTWLPAGGGVPSFAIPGILCHPCGILKELVLILVFLTLFATATKKPHFKIFFK